MLPCWRKDFVAWMLLQENVTAPMQTTKPITTTQATVLEFLSRKNNFYNTNGSQSSGIQKSLSVEQKEEHKRNLEKALEWIKQVRKIKIHIKFQVQRNYLIKHAKCLIKCPDDYQILGFFYFLGFKTGLIGF